MLPGTVGRDRRRIPRYERDDLSVCLPELQVPSSPFPEASVVDVSFKGLGLCVRGEVRPGDKLPFRLDIPGGPVQGTAVVRWTRPQEGSLRCGVEILRMDWSQSRRLRSFLDPERPDLFSVCGRLFDMVLRACFYGIVVLLALDYLGIPLGRLPELVVSLFVR